MPARIKNKIKTSKDIIDFRKVKRIFYNELKEDIKKAIVSTIKKGRSPVEDAGRYEDYSEPYKKQIRRGRGKFRGKSTSPVNLTLTGKMLNSIKVRKTKDGLSIFFTDSKAKYHDRQGAGPSKVIRALLPQGGERFIRSIREKIRDALLRALRK